jgi:hypothetical protein
MTGALIQLVAKGVQDIFMIRDPQITYFKIVYRRHTNFSLEAIPQYFTHKPDFGKKVTCTISQNGDLVGKTHLVVTLPKIKPFILEDGTIDPLTKFAWVKKLGYALIKNVELEIGGQLIDRQYGDWLNIISELFIRKEDSGLDKMIGNIEDLTSFTSTKDKYTLYVPLQFWFCRNPSLAIPILCLHHSEIKINLELNDLESCYILTPTHYLEVEDELITFEPFEYIYQNINNEIASGIFSGYDPIDKKIYYTRISRNKFLSLPDEDGQTYTIEDILKSQSQFLIKSRTSDKFCIPRIGSSPKIYTNREIENVTLQDCYLLVTYIYLDSEERNRFVQAKHEYLIEQVHIFNPQNIQASNYGAKIDSINPTRFIVWFVQQQYFLDYNNNDHFNYTDDYMYKLDDKCQKYILNGKSLILNENILFNGYDRISSRNYKYFNHVQPYQHFEVSPDEGINVYSFSLEPEKFQPSGSCNSSYIGLTEIKMNLNHIINDKNTGVFKGYSMGQNIFRIIDGLGGLVFIR